jgi:hypothetical protein
VPFSQLLLLLLLMMMMMMVHMSLDFKFDPTMAEKWRDLRS